jgi:hypothetical protein
LPDFAAAACRPDAGIAATSEGKSEMLGAALLLLLPPLLLLAAWPALGGLPDRRTGTQAGCACVAGAPPDKAGKSSRPVGASSSASSAAAKLSAA